MEVTEGCGADIFVPNAFSPNGDGINDIFYVVQFNPLISIYIQIWSRWGELLFEANDLTTGWNGEISEAAAEVGAYIRVITYEKETFDGP
jgi:gliding motility-associated-like protein